MIEIVAATRLGEADFWARSALGQSLRRLALAAPGQARIAFANTRGLPELYNARIEAADGAELLVFVHDDVWIDDFYFAERVAEGLERFEVIGVAGNRRRLPGQPAWAFVDTRLTWDDRSQLSGRVAHGSHPFGAVAAFGPAPQACELLDGVLLAARRPMLIESGVRFDPRFRFHAYDLDFCRTARARGLRLGTWPICLTHQSGGQFGSPAWLEGVRLYLDKWSD